MEKNGTVSYRDKRELYSDKLQAHREVLDILGYSPMFPLEACIRQAETMKKRRFDGIKIETGKRTCPLSARSLYRLEHDLGEINFVMMERLQKYVERYTFLDAEARDFLSRHGKIRHCPKDSYYVVRYERKSTWCFILQGLVSFESMDAKGKVSIERVGTVHQYFSGTKHPYSISGSEVAIRFLKDSYIYEIPNQDFQTAIRQFAEIGHIYHILKQHNLHSLEVFLRINKMDRTQRLTYLYTQMPELKGQLTVEQLCSLLGYTDHRQYYKALEKFNRS